MVFLRVTLRALATLGLFAVMLALHLPTRAGREAARDVVHRFVSPTLPGRLRLGSIDRLSPWGLTVTGVRYADAEGHVLVEGGTVRVERVNQLVRAALGRAPFPPITARVATLHARVPVYPARPSTPSRPSAPSTTVYRFPSLTLDVDRVVNELPSPVPWRAEGVHLQGSVVAPPQGLSLRLAALRASVSLADLAPTALSGHFSLDTPRRVEGALSLDGGLGRCRASVRTESSRYTARVWDCAPRAEALDALARQPLGLRVAVREATLEGPVEGPWALALDATVNDSPASLRARGDLFEQRADLTVAHLSLASLRRGLPPTDLDGTLHAERQALSGGAQRLSVDTSRLVASVQGVPVPPLRVTAVHHRTRVTVEDLRSEPIGLEGRGFYDYARREGDFRVEASLQTRELSSLPWVRGRARGALRLGVRAEGHGRAVQADLTADARALSVAGARAATAHVSGTGSYDGARATVDATVRASGLQVPGRLGPTNVTATVRGDPEGTLAVGFDAQGEGLLAGLGAVSPEAGRGPTFVRGEARVTLDERGTTLALPRVTASLRGAEATVTGNVRLPPSGGRPQGTLRVVTAQGARADVELRGRAVELSLARFQLAWLTGFLRLPPSLAGVADGALTLDPGDLGRTRASLTLADGRIDPLGGFRAALEVTPRAGALDVRASVSTRRGATLEATLRSAVPRDPASADGWLQGLEGGEAALGGVSIPAFQDLLPLGAGGLSGVLPSALRTEGTLDAALSLTRAPGHPLAVAFAAQGRGLSLSTPFGPVAVPLRFAARGCASVPSASADDLPLDARVELGEDDRSPRVPLTPGCSREATLLPTSLAAVGVTLRGPWVAGARGTMRDYARAQGATPSTLTEETRRLLGEAWGALSVKVGPVRRDAWPLRRLPIGFDPEEGVVFLTPPDVPRDSRAVLEASASGPLLGLALQAEADFSAGNAEAVGLEEPFRGRAAVRVSPAEGETLLGPVRVDVNGLVELSPALPREQRGQVALDLIVRADVAALARRGSEAVAIQRFDVDSENIALERFSWARSQGLRGRLAARVVATNDVARPVEATFHATGVTVRQSVGARTVRETAPLDATVRAVVTHDHGALTLLGCASAAAEGRSECEPERDVRAPLAEGGLQLQTVVPLTGTLPRVGVALERARADLRARGFRLETLSPAVHGESVTSVGGSLTGELSWRGAQRYAVTGRVDLTDGSLALTSLGEPLRDLTLRATARERTVTVEALEASLGQGSLRSTGSVALGGDHVAVVDLHARLSELPAVQEGNTFARLSGSTRVELTLDEGGATGNVSFDGLRVLVAEQERRNLQPLSPDPDVYVYGRTEVARARGARRDRGYPIELGYDFRTPVWLRRSDFAIAIQGNGRVRIDPAGVALFGTISLASTRSWFEIFGKRFYFQRATIGFDGGVGLNPQLDLAAQFDSPTAGRLGVTITGNLREPTLTFSSERFPAASQSDILAMIVVGRTQTPQGAAQGDLTSQASAAAGSLVTGLTMGIVSSTLRREVSFLPTIIAEPGESVGSGRYGAGITVTPRLYVQATYGAASAAGVGGLGASAGGQVAAEFRVLAEYVVSSAFTLSGTYGTSGRWGVDFFWSP